MPLNAAKFLRLLKVKKRKQPWKKNNYFHQAKWSLILDCQWLAINWKGDLALWEIAPLCSLQPMCEQWPFCVTSVSATTRRTLNNSNPVPHTHKSQSISYNQTRTSTVTPLNCRKADNYSSYQEGKNALSISRN